MNNPTFIAPPAPLGNGRGRAGGFSATGETNTQLGDRVEAALIEQMGYADFHPGQRHGPFDVRSGQTVYEVKAVTRAGTEYKTKLKACEVQGKLDHAHAQGLLAATMMVVVDGPTGWVYAREGVGSWRLGPKWAYVGQVEL